MASNWDKDKPAGTDKIRDSDDLIRANNAALEDAIGRNHNFPGDEGTNAGEHTVVEIQDQGEDPETLTNIVSVYNNGNALFVRLQENGDIIALGASAIPAGTKMLFPQPLAPTGWTFESENNDRVLINQDTEIDGGGTAGTWTISGVTVDGHTLTITEMPAHIHSLERTGAAVGSGSAYDQVRTSPPANLNVSSTGGDGSHDHGLTADGDWRPAYLGVITCTKD